jgi:bile acid:Na+ symporter, BASS family
MILAKVFAIVMLVSLTFGAGLQVDRDHLFAILKNFSLLSRALIANFILVPLFGALVAHAFGLPAPIATGFLLMAIAPGVPFVMTSVRKRGGRLALAVALAFFMPLLSLITIPITAALVLPPGAQAQLPISKFVPTLLLFQILPLILGIAAGRRIPGLTDRLERPLQIVFFAAVAALLVVLFPTIVRDIGVIYGSRGMFAMLTLVLLSLVTGWLLGGPHREDRRVLAIGTGLRNVGLCATIATSTFASSDVAASVLTYLIIQAVIVSALGIYFTKTAQSETA